jgi:hypothetical protein
MTSADAPPWLYVGRRTLMPKSKKKPGAPPPARSIFSMHLRAGDRFTDETGQWEVVSLPTTSVGGETVRARVRKVGDPAVIEQRVWGTYVRVAVRRG